MLHSTLARVSTLLALLVVGFACARGRWPERAAALAVLVDWTGSIVLQDRRWHHHLQGFTFGLDLAQAAVLLLLVVGCRRTWVMWAAAFCTLLVLTHLAVMVDLRFDQWSYLTAVYVWSFGLLGALAIGVAVEGARSPGPLRLPGLTGVRPSTPNAMARSRS